MAKGFAHRLNERRKKGPSKFEGQRGPNSGAWEKTHFTLRKAAQNAGWSRGYNTGGR